MPRCCKRSTDWLAPWLEGVTRREHLARVPLTAALQALLGGEQRRRLAEWAPAQLSLPGGTRARIDYLDASAPLVAVRLQEVFGLAATPRLGAAPGTGDVPAAVAGAAPGAGDARPGGFWRGSYAEVRKQLRGRYPKHHWPEDPLTAPPQRATRRR